MDQVNSCRESRASERDFELPARAQGAQPTAKNGQIPRLFRADHRAERLSALDVLADAKDSNSRYPMGSKLDAMSSVTAVSASRVLSLTN